MLFFKPKYHFSDVSPKVVGFFFSQYVQVMRHGKDKVDQRMKKYLYSVCLGLGVPDAEFEEEQEAEIVPEQVQLPAPTMSKIVINQRGKPLRYVEINRESNPLVP